MTKWHKGPPPSIGWWPASTFRDRSIIRWWDGTRWSMACSDVTAASEVNEWTPEPTYATGIEWTERPDWWPERSKT